MADGGQRLWRAALVTFVALLLAGGGAGFIAAAEQHTDVNRAFTVPAPRPGDFAVYSIQEVMPDPTIVTSKSVPKRATYEWLPERADLDDSFGERLVHPLRSTFTFSDRTLIRETTYDAATGAVVSESSLWSWQRGGYWGGSEGSGGTRVDASGRFDNYQGQIGPCGFRASLQGREYDGHDILVQGRCDLSGRSDFLFVDEGWTPTGPGLVREFRDAQDPQLFLQFDESSPFPRRSAAALSDALGSSAIEGRTFILDRIDSASGTATYTPIKEPLVSRGGGPVPSAPRTAWGFDEIGLPSQRFPLSEAYQAALTQPTIPASGSRGEVGPDAATWLQEHPLAYLASAMPFEGRDRTEQPITSWFLAWTDGTSVLGKQVAYAPAGVQFLYLPNATGQEARVYDWDTHNAWNASGSGAAPWTPPWSASWPWQQGGLVQPSDAPQALPRPADLMARYITIGGNEKPNVYGFSIECADAVCSEPAVIVVGGYSIESWDNRYTSQYDVLVHPLYSIRDILAVDGAGRLDYRWRHNTFESAAFPVLPAPASNPPPAESATASPAWAFPSSPAAAASISFIAFILGMLYYFWPALKGLSAFGLFSRTRDDHLLDHSTRRRIHDAINSEPGIHFMALARKSGVGRGTLDHHLRKLTGAGLVTARKASGYKCYFAKGAAHPNVVQAASLLRSEGSRAVFDAIRANPGLPGRELARRLRRSPSTVHYHVHRLEEAGLILEHGAGMRLSPQGERLLL